MGWPRWDRSFPRPSAASLAALKVRPVVAIPMRARGTRLGPSREREGKPCLRVAALEPLVLAAFGPLHSRL